MAFRAPMDEIAFALRQAASDWAVEGLWGELSDGNGSAVLEQAGRFADERLAPLNVVGDRHPAERTADGVRTPPGWREAYRTWREGGWAGLAASPDLGGSGLSHLLLAGCLDAWNGANMAFMLAPLLSFAASDALAAHARPELRDLYLRRIVSGEWTATMNLTEPQAGSDLSDLRTRAEPAADGAFRLFGQKIFITYGDHDLTDNVVHLVLARLPDAPAGPRGLSLFLAPKMLVDSNGRPGQPNDLRCVGLERKLGIHGAPTCAMVFGESGGARAWLIGEPHRGLTCMFTMMNNARLAVGLEGVGVSEAAAQAALAFARERRQGRAPGSTGSDQSLIIEHPDVRRMLLTMRAGAAAARAVCYRTAAAIDVAGVDGPARLAATERAALLTPVAKAFATDLANEIASLAIQTHGGMGYIEETGVAQLLRDARIAAIYEGTNGIQAIDLVQRKITLREGGAVRDEIAALGRMMRNIEGRAPAATTVGLARGLDALSSATDWLLASLMDGRTTDALAGATPYLRLFGLVCGGALLGRAAWGAEAGSDANAPKRAALARFFAENMVAAAPGLAGMVRDGAASTLDGAGLV
jgi:alkylation response protein AidB-like acyl-CoA dehydrogenase